MIPNPNQFPQDPSTVASQMDGAKYMIIYYDGAEGAKLGGMTTQAEIEKRYGSIKQLSRNDDGLLELDDTDMLAVPCTGPEFQWDDDE